MDKDEALKFKFLRASEADYTGLWQIIGDVKEIFKPASRTELEQIVLSFIEQLLNENLATTVDLREDGGCDEWQANSVHDMLVLIKEKWLESSEDWEYGIWFNISENGKKVLAELNLRYLALSNSLHQIVISMIPELAMHFFNTQYEHFIDRKNLDLTSIHHGLLDYFAKHKFKSEKERKQLELEIKKKLGF